MEAQRKLHVVRASLWRNVYEMRENNTKIAILELHNPHGSRATIHGDDFKMRVIRTKFLPKEIELQEDNQGAIHTFHSRWDSKGWVNMHGKKYFWNPANKTWTTWKWEDHEGNELMRLSYNPFRPFAARGRVKAHPSLSARELRYLGLLGWYLILLDFELAGSRVLSAMELAVRRLKTARAGFAPIIIAIVIALVAVLVGGGYIVYKNRSQQQPTINNLQQTTQNSRPSSLTTNNSASSTIDISGWKTYTTRWATFRLPPSLAIKKFDLRKDTDLDTPTLFEIVAETNNYATSGADISNGMSFSAMGTNIEKLLSHLQYASPDDIQTSTDAEWKSTPQSERNKHWWLSTLGNNTFVITDSYFYNPNDAGWAGTTFDYPYRFEFTISSPANLSEDDKKILEQILSTFTFTTPSSTVVIRGTVLVNNQGCAADSACFLTIQFDDGKKIDVGYGSGLTPSGACYRSEGFGFKQGDRVEISGKFSDMNAISLCEPNTYIRKI